MPRSVLVGSPVTFQVNALDQLGVTMPDEPTFNWSIVDDATDNIIYTSTGNSGDSSTLTHIFDSIGSAETKTYHVNVSATVDGVTKSASAPLSVLLHNDPVYRIMNPTDGAIISDNASISIIATKPNAEDNDPLNWFLWLQPASGDRVLLASGTKVVGDASGIGEPVYTLNPNDFNSGQYTIELTKTDDPNEAPVDTRSIQITSTVSVSAPTSAEIDIAWAADPNPDVLYTIYRSTTPNFSPSENNLLTFTQDPSFDDYHGLSSGETYYYYIEKVEPDGSSTPVAHVSGTTSAFDSSLPDQPTNLTEEETNTTDVDLSWTDNSNNETGFKIEWAHEGQNDWTLAQIAPPNSDAATVFNLDPNTTYDFRVTSINHSITQNSTSLPATTQATTQPNEGKPFIMLVGGNLQTQAMLLGGLGIGKIYKTLRDTGKYDVHMYASYFEENINDDGIRQVRTRDRSHLKLLRRGDVA
jgi:hypothetical protein